MVKFSINGIPIAVQPLFWLVAVFLGFDVFRGPNLVLWVGIVFVSILVHELGHALTAQAYGHQPRVLLHGFGGVTTWAATPALSPVRRILVTLAGPFSGFALAGLAWLVLEFAVGDGRGTVYLVAIVLVRVNLLWGLFNLFPIRGLDGGQTVAGVLALIWPKRAEVVAEVIYVVCGIGAAVFGVLSGFYLLAVFAVVLTFSGMFTSRTPADPAPPPPVLRPDPAAPPRRDGDGDPPLLGI